MKVKMVEDPLMSDLMHTLAHVKEMMNQRFMCDTKDFKLNRQSAELLYLIDHTSKSQKEIAEILCIREATLSVRIKRLEKIGYLRKEADEKDRRRYRLFLTDKARDELDEGIQKVNEFYDVLTKGLTQEDIESLLRVYKKVEKNLEEMEGS